MGKLSSADLENLEKPNYEATKDGRTYRFYARSNKEAWFLTYEWLNSKTPDTLDALDENGDITYSLMEFAD